MAFHDLIYNKTDAELAREFCAQHGLTFMPRRMYICSLGEAVAFHERREGIAQYYGEFIDPDEATPLMRTLDDVKTCCWRNVITLNFDGRLYRCCGVYDQNHFMGSFFDFKIKEIPFVKSSVCDQCGVTPVSWR